MPPSNWKSTCGRLFGIDLRTLALFRALIASILLWNLATRAVDLTVMYTDEGFLPLETVRQYYGPDTWRWSLHFFSGSWGYQATLFAISALFALALFFGFQTRIATIGSWILLVSLHTRVPILVTGGDVLLSMFLLWGMFLPLGGCFSLDARRRPYPYDRHVVSVATAAVLIQVVVMYFFTGITKSNWLWFQGDAIQNVLSYDMIARPLGQQLKDVFWLTSVLSIGTVCLELAAPLLLLSPWKTQTLRVVGLVGLVLLHVAIELTMRVTIFSFVSMAGLSLFLPPAVWRWRRADYMAAESKETPVLTAPSGGLVMLREGLCLILLAFVLLWNSYLLWMNYSYASVRNNPARRVAELTLVSQRWDMFAMPAMGDYRYIAAAKLINGNLVDAFRDQQLSDSVRPDQLSAEQPSHRWMQIFVELVRDENAIFRHKLAEYLCDRWNREHTGDHRAENLKLLVVEQLAEPDENGQDVRTLLLARVDPFAEGKYKNWQPHGYWVHYTDGQKTSAGRYEAGKREGHWQHWFPDGRLEGEGSYLGGELHGKWVFWLEDGSERLAYFDEGQMVPVPVPGPGQEVRN